MFDSSPFEKMPSAPAPEMAPPRRDGGPGIKLEQLKEITSFFADVVKEEKGKEDESELLVAMAEAGRRPDDDLAWEMLIDQVRGRPHIGDFTKEQIRKAMRGSPIFEQAIDVIQDSSERLKEDEEDVDVSELK